MSRQNSLLERGAVFLQPQRINEKINNESIDFFHRQPPFLYYSME